MQGGRAGFPSSDPEARRPLPAASPASGAGAGLARHLLHIDAAAASRASRAPGMQRRWRAGPCLERGRARSTPDLSIRLSLSSHQSRCWGIRWQAQDVGSLSPCSLSPLPGDLPMKRPFPVAKNPGFVFRFLCYLSPPVLPWTNRLTSLGPSLPLSKDVGNGPHFMEWRGNDCSHVCSWLMGRAATLGVWAISFITLPQLPPASGSLSPEAGGSGRGGNTQPVKSCACPVCQACGWCRDTVGESNTPGPEVDETYSKSSDIQQVLGWRCSVGGWFPLG